MKRLSLFLLAGLVSLTAVAPAARAEDKKIRIILVDGQNNHNWRVTTPWLKKVLEDCGRFTVDVTSNLKQGDKPGNIENTVPFPPDLTKYDVLLSNYNGAPWPKEFQKAVEEGVANAKLALVIVHAANNAFGGWAEYYDMIGMGWQAKGFGDRVKYESDGKEVRVPKGEGDGSGHRYTGPFTVTLRDREHPITKDMPAEWLHARDELYDNMRGPIKNVKMLATAFSKGTNTHEPMIWTISYGKGRVFHTPMGHDLNAMRCVGFIATLQRGTEWAATDKVTVPLPKDFPTAAKESVRPEK